ncbi:MAG: hypothetical protein WBS54_13525 [Acidobacteriota bacterium]
MVSLGKGPAPFRRPAGAALVALLGLTAAAALLLFWQYASHSPKYAVLRSNEGGRWIRLPEPANPNARPVFPRIAHFRCLFTAGKGEEHLVVRVAALRRCQLWLNGRTVLPPGDGAPWYRGSTVDLAPFLHPGTNELVAVVENSTGPPVFRLTGEGGGASLSTPGEWGVSMKGQDWQAPQLATEKRPFPASLQYPSAWWGLLGGWPWLAGLLALALAVAAALAMARRWGRKGLEEWIAPSRLRWLLLGLYALLCLHNLFRLSLWVGFDAPAHYSYIAFILQHHRLPLATDGWQMFESPLFYILGALVEVTARLVASPKTAEGLVRLISMACGAGMIEVSYRTGRLLFAERPALQRVATVAGGLLPMNVYMSQYVGNEPLEGLLAAWALFLGLRLLLKEENPPSLSESLALGGVLGLALLAKVTALLLVGPLAALVLWAAFKREAPPRRALGSAGALLAACGAVSGWYYLRNWIDLGRPFVGGWQARPGLTWWQDPGYRMAGDLLRFGHSLVQPIYAAGYGVWDALYSSLWLDGALSSVTNKPLAPFWQPHLLPAMALLALPLSLLILWGIARTFGTGETPAQRGLRFLLACGVLYLGAMVALTIEVPTYTAAKASYALALAPALGALAAYGAEPLLRWPRLRALVGLYLFVWAGVVYCTYWAR